jgi:hypothetical protein
MEADRQHHLLSTTQWGYLRNQLDYLDPPATATKWPFQNRQPGTKEQTQKNTGVEAEAEAEDRSKNKRPENMSHLHA